MERRFNTCIWFAEAGSPIQFLMRLRRRAGSVISAQSTASDSIIGKKDCLISRISLAVGLISPYNSKQVWSHATLLPTAPLARDNDAATAEIRDGRQGDAGQAAGRRAPP